MSTRKTLVKQTGQGSFPEGYRLKVWNWEGVEDIIKVIEPENRSNDLRV